jgi:adenosylcobinamide-GDP ribazoletransferase
MAISQNWLADRATELQASLAFCTRLPLLRATPTASDTLAKAAWALPLAGLVVGLIGAAAYAIARKFGLPPWPASALAVGATVLVTGALHEDGLADTADGFGGGATREQKLDIMRDSHVGAYGVCALVLSLLLRVAAVASMPNGHLAVWALIGAHTAARAIVPVMMFLLPPARSDGLSFEAGRPQIDGVAAAVAIGFVVLAFCIHPGRAIIAAIFLGLVVALMAWLAQRQIAGQTGDVLGALEQVSEITVLLVALS